jgi:hypothetical protein
MTTPMLCGVCSERISQFDVSCRACGNAVSTPPMTEQLAAIGRAPIVAEQSTAVVESVDLPAVGTRGWLESVANTGNAISAGTIGVVLGVAGAAAGIAVDQTEHARFRNDVETAVRNARR